MGNNHNNYKNGGHKGGMASGASPLDCSLVENQTHRLAVERGGRGWAGKEESGKIGKASQLHKGKGSKRGQQDQDKSKTNKGSAGGKESPSYRTLDDDQRGERARGRGQKRDGDHEARGGADTKTDSATTQ